MTSTTGSRGVAGPQAVSIFRHLDHDSTGTVTGLAGARLVRMADGWHRGAILHGDPRLGCVCARI